MEKTKLNIGSGVRPLNKPGNEWLDLDIRPEDCRFGEMLAHSVLEHFYKRDVDKCLSECGFHSIKRLSSDRYASELKVEAYRDE